MQDAENILIRICDLKRISQFCLILISIFSLTACGIMQKTVVKEKSKGQEVVETASKQLGRRFIMGGDSPRKGFDCSGLLWWAYHKHGINIPRISVHQLKAGKNIDYKDIEPGDIIIFRTNRGPHGLHTGLYSGNGLFIHSSSKMKKVRKEKLDTEYWRKRLIAVRRPF